MTAYGRSKSQKKGLDAVVEIHSVNRKGLDIQSNLPREFLRFETDLRSWISHEIQRGQLVVRLNLNSEAALPSTALLKRVKKQWEQISKELGFDPKQTVTLSFLMQQLALLPNAEKTGEESKVAHALKALVEEALEALVEMKEREGKALAADIAKRLKEIQACIVQIRSRSKGSTERYLKKLKEKIQSALEASEELEERLLREAVLFAERIDTTEELTRLDSHLEQFFVYMKSKEKSVGRALDFLSQEMNREINTLSTKSLDSEISHIAVKMKSELEKIREQVQNIE